MLFRFIHAAVIALACRDAALAQPVTTATSPARVSTVSGREPALQAIADAWVARTGVPGVTLAVIGPDGSMSKVAAGVSRVASGAQMKPDDRMFAGSIGKTYFAAAILQLVGEGRLSLDEKIAVRVGGEPWFATLPNAQDLTLRVLLNHTSGIAEHVESPAFLGALKADPMKRWEFGDLLLRFVCGKPALFAVGESWSYADTNYIVAGLVVEKVTGTPMYTLVRDRILTPLNLVDTVPSDGPQIAGLITGYEGPKKLFAEAEEFAVDGACVLNPQFEWCGGGFVSTSPDLARWGRALWGGGVLSPEMKGEMLKAISEKRTGPSDAYGLGVIVWQSPLGRALGHTGMFPGYVSQVFYFEDSRVTVAMQTNSMDFSRLKGLRGVILDAARAMGAGRDPAPAE